MADNTKFNPTPVKHYIRGISVAVILSLLTFPVTFFIDDVYPILLIFFWVVTALLLSSVTVEKKFITIQLEENSMSIHTGVLSTKTIIIPAKKITNIKLRRNIFDRISGVASVEVDTAGQDVAEIIIDDLPMDKVKQIMEYAKSKAHHEKE